MWFSRKKLAKFKEKEDLLNKKVFWNLASAKWGNEISKEVRKTIKDKLKVLKGKNLSLGCGNYPYVKDSVLVDFSSEMLKKAKGKKKINLNLDEGKLPFEDSTFDSVTMIFIVDYIKNLKKLLKEVKRVLKKEGTLIIVNSKKAVEHPYKKHQIKHYGVNELEKLLKGFKIKVKKLNVGKVGLVFVEGSL